MVRRDEFLQRWWVRVLLSGIPFGVMIGLFVGHRDSVRERVLIGVIGGLVLGLAVGWSDRRQVMLRRQRITSFTAGLTEEGRWVAERASRRGPVPDDPQIRSAAAGLARDGLERVLRERTYGLVSFGLITLSWVLLATTRSWGWLVVVVLVATIVFLLLRPRMVRQRLVLLERENVHGG